MCRRSCGTKLWSGQTRDQGKTLTDGLTAKVLFVMRWKMGANVYLALRENNNKNTKTETTTTPPTLI